MQREEAEKGRGEKEEKGSEERGWKIERIERGDGRESEMAASRRWKSKTL